MGTIKDQIEHTKAQIVDAEQRIGHERRRVEKKLVERHPADEAQAKLLIMEQSLIAMTRYLQKLVSGFEGTEPSPSKRQVSKHRGFTPKPIGER